MVSQDLRVAGHRWSQSIPAYTGTTTKIGDLLASITGEKSPSKTSSPVLPAKRKADDDLKSSAAFKAQRTGPVPSTSSPANQDASRQSRSAVERSTSSYLGTSRQPNTAPRPLPDKSASSSSKKPSPSPAKPSPTASRFASTSKAPLPSLSLAPVKPSPTAGRFASTPREPSSTAIKRPLVAPHPSVDSAPKAAPKKGSYAEIKARAAENLMKIQQMGKIQHKSVEKVQTQKERDAVESRAAARKAVNPVRSGAARPGASRNGINGARGNGNGVPDRARAGGQKPANGKAAKAPVEETRKPKKSALATTGYAGTARPRPGASSNSGSAKAAPANGSRGPDRGPPNPMGMFSRGRRRDDEYDEELDDFVEYDEDDDEDGYHRAPGGYSDEDESDMEAGFSDVDQEESKAARLARLEDQREEAILEQRRREKEARKRGISSRR